MGPGARGGLLAGEGTSVRRLTLIGTSGDSRAITKTPRAVAGESLGLHSGTGAGSNQRDGPKAQDAADRGKGGELPDMHACWTRRQAG